MPTAFDDEPERDPRPEGQSPPIPPAWLAGKNLNTVPPDPRELPTEIRKYADSAYGVEFHGDEPSIMASVEKILATRQAVDAALAGVPPGKHVAVVGTYKLSGEASLSAFVRAGDDWSFMGFLAHAPKKGWSGEVAVVKAF